MSAATVLPTIQPEPEYPVPARYWWVKRMFVATVVVAICLAGVRAWWGLVADRRLQSVLDDVAARGEPVRATDLDPPAIPDAENAAHYLNRAAKAVNPTAWSPANTGMMFPAAFTPYSPGWDAVAGASVAANPTVYPLARQARAHDRFDWGPRVGKQGLQLPLAHLNELRMLANTLGDAALYAHAHGDDVASLETVRDVRHAARSSGAPPLLITSLVGIGVDALALARLAEMAPGLQVTEQEVSPAEKAAAFPTTAPVDPPRGASAADVRALIAELLDERDPPGDIRRGVAGERAVNVGMVEDLGRSARLVAPMFKLDLIKMIRDFNTTIDAAGKPTWPAAKATLGKLPPPAGPLARVLMPSLGRAVETEFRVRCERRMVAVALAVRMYHQEHGAWPATLEALVPKYLPHVPGDVFAADGSALRYLVIPGGRPDGGDRPVVYSVADDGNDDTAAGRVKVPATEMYGWQARAADQWNDLSRWPAPPPPPATNGAN